MGCTFKILIASFLALLLNPIVNAQDTVGGQLIPISPKRVDSPISGSPPFGAGINMKCSPYPMRDSFLYVLKGSAAASVGFPFFAGSASKNNSVIIQEYSLYDIVDSKRQGVGTRMFITVSEKSIKAGTLSIPFLTLNAERGKLEAKVHLQTIGINNDKLPHLESPIELNFTTLTNMYQQMGSIKDLICSNETILTPYILAEPYKGSPSEEKEEDQ